MIKTDVTVRRVSVNCNITNLGKYIFLESGLTNPLGNATILSYYSILPMQVLLVFISVERGNQV